MNSGMTAPNVSLKRRTVTFQRAPAAWFAITSVTAPMARPSQ